MIVNVCNTHTDGYSLKQSVIGDWVVNKDTFINPKYIVGVSNNKILGVFENKMGFQIVDNNDGNDRVRFEKIVRMYEGSMRISQLVKQQLTSTHFTTKYLTIET